MQLVDDGILLPKRITEFMLDFAQSACSSSVSSLHAVFPAYEN
jgi:hypothetical protein